MVFCLMMDLFGFVGVGFWVDFVWLVVLVFVFVVVICVSMVYWLLGVFAVESLVLGWFVLFDVICILFGGLGYCGGWCYVCVGLCFDLGCWCLGWVILICCLGWVVLYGWFEALIGYVLVLGFWGCVCCVCCCLVWVFVYLGCGIWLFLFGLGFVVVDFEV